jgi:uncharacterized protein YbaP (TraB family)
MQALVLQYGLDPTHPLSDKLTPAENATLAQAAQTAGIPRWHQTLRDHATMAGRADAGGGAADEGRPRSSAWRRQAIAGADGQAGKPVNGLETSEQQIRFLADLSPNVELDLLRSTLHDVDKGSTELTEPDQRLESRRHRNHRAAGRRGCAQRITAAVSALIVDRNQAWAAKIAAMLQQPGTVFIAVGAAHLAGPDSVQAQLAKLGITTQTR